MPSSSGVRLPPLKEPLPDIRDQVICTDVARAYTIKASVVTAFFVPLLAWSAYTTYQSLYTDPQTVEELRAVYQHMQYQAYNILAAMFLLIFGITMYLSRREAPIYLVDFSVFVPEGDELKITREKFKRISRESGWFTDDAIGFQERLLARNGLGEHTYFPPAIVSPPSQEGSAPGPPKLDMKGAREEFELVVFTAITDLFERTGVKPSEIDILVVNCSLFCPTPSLSAIVINKFKMKSDLQSYNLGGMGCSAGLISVHLAKDLLQRYPNSNALVVSTENITQNWYNGDEKSMMLSNTIFRMGGAAVLLTNKSQYALTAKYSLQHTVRVHKGAKDDMYGCIFQREDAAGKIGVSLSREIMTVAGRALLTNMTLVAPVILPFTEHIRWFRNLILRTAHKYTDAVVSGKPMPRGKDAPRGGVDKTAAAQTPDTKADDQKETPDPVGNVLQVAVAAIPALLFLTPVRLPVSVCKSLSNLIGDRVGTYTPDFKTCISHWCIHAGGRAVIDAMQSNLNLSEYDVEPSRRTLERFGNTSSSSVWYELAFIEQTQRIQAGQQVFQISFGSGFKCNSAVWKAINVGVQNGRPATPFPVDDLEKEMLGI